MQIKRKENWTSKTNMKWIFCETKKFTRFYVERKQRFKYKQCYDDVDAFCLLEDFNALSVPRNYF